LVAFHASFVDRVVTVWPDLRERFIVVAQAASLGPGEPFDLSAFWSLPASRVLFVFAGGIRGVKRPRLPLGPFDVLVERQPAVRLLYVGPVLDPDEGRALLVALEGRPWARYIGA